MIEWAKNSLGLGRGTGGRRATRRGVALREVLWLGALGVALVGVGAGVATVNTTVNDFFQGGTQPNMIVNGMTSINVCSLCHYDYDATHEPFRPWAASMMGQAGRDPVFHAALAIANQDAANAGETCLRCHAPQGWIAGRSTPADGSALQSVDFEGVSCSTCHRMVDPIYHPGSSPAVDQSILANLPTPPVNAGNGSYILDPYDRRRGPFDLAMNPHAWLRSPYHQSANLCATCHEVSNPMFSRQPDGSYILNALDARHPTGNKYDMMPEQRTYSEWSMSEFAQGAGVDMRGRFGGNKPVVSTCQDCHMQDASGVGCSPAFGPTFRNDLPSHFFNGANTWVLKAVRDLYPDTDTYLSDETVNASLARTEQMLRNASDVEVTIPSAGTLNVRITNQSGHKLPTGYGEGRRMWVNVKFFGGNGEIVDEHGAYDTDTAHLVTTDTKVYEAKAGLDPYAAALFGRPEGETFSLMLVNKFFKDNRIPPRGFTNANFASVQAAPVGATYADGQYWDDTPFAIPPGAVTAQVRVFYQTTTREYIEFLRDANVTNHAGEIAYDQWVTHGKSKPAQMDYASVNLLGCVADFDDGTGTGTRDGGVTLDDLLYYLGLYEIGSVECDVDDGSSTGTRDRGVTLDDLLYYLQRFEQGC